MTFFKELRERRLFQFVAGFAAVGWIAVEVLNDLIERGIAPEFLYGLALVWYVGGLVATTIIGWYHGERGRQDMPYTEVVFLGGVAVAVLALSGFQVFNHLEEARADELRDGGLLDARRVAVLYFDDYTSDSNEGYLGDALTESLIEELSEVGSLDVVSRNGVEPFREGDVPLDSVARILQAGTLVGGTVAPVSGGDGVRVTVQLADGSSGAQFRRASFERPTEDVFEVQAELMREVALLLREWMGEEIRLRETTRGTESVAAWQLVQRAERARKDAAERADAGDEPGARRNLQAADSLLALAEEVDPAWPEPSALRATVAYRRSHLTGTPQERRLLIQEGIRYAERALGMEKDYAAALEARGVLRYWSWINQLESDPVAQSALLQGGREDLERAVEVDPDRASAYATLSLLYYEPGIADATLAAIAARRAYETDAFLRDADWILYRLFMTNLNLQQFSQARRWCDEGQRRFSGNLSFITCDLWLMLAPGSDPTPDEVWEVVSRVEEAAAGVNRELTVLQARMMAGAVLAKSGLPDSARSVLETAHEEYMRLDDPTREVLGMEALGWINLGELDHAIDLLKLYVVTHHGFQRSGDMAWWWRPLRDHPRFDELVTQESPSG